METRASIKETGRQMKETGQRMKTLQKSMGDLDHRFGELAGHLVVPNIIDKFNALGCHFKDVCRERKLYREDRTAGAEFDILLENGESIVGVEVKAKPRARDIEDHIERLAFLRKYKDELGDKRKNIHGALAGAIMPDNVRRAAGNVAKCCAFCFRSFAVRNSSGGGWAAQRALRVEPLVLWKPICRGDIPFRSLFFYQAGNIRQIYCKRK